MNAFLRKLRLSFLAMLCGWVACNIAWWIGIVPEIVKRQPAYLNIFEVLHIGVATGIVILFFWIVIFLPVDLIVPDESKLRKPANSGLCGFLSAFSLVAFLFAYAAWFEITRHGILEGIWATLDLKALPYALGTCVTGTVAAYVRARMDKPPTASP